MSLRRVISSLLSTSTKSQKPVASVAWPDYTYCLPESRPESCSATWTNNYRALRKLSGDFQSNCLNMAVRLVQFQGASDDSQRVGVELENGGNVVDITSIDGAIPSDMRSFLENWDSNLAATFR